MNGTQNCLFKISIFFFAILGSNGITNCRPQVLMLPGSTLLRASTMLLATSSLPHFQNLKKNEQEMRFSILFFLISQVIFQGFKDELLRLY